METLRTSVQLEVMKYEGLEAGTSLVVFEENTTSMAGVGGCWGRGIGGECGVGEVGRSQVAL